MHSAPPPPKGLVSIQAVLDEDGVKAGNMVNLAGIVKDCRLPIPTRGSDFKMEITLFDLSTEDDRRDIRLSIFRPQDKMPDVKLADVVLLSSVKVQNWSGNQGLITHHSTTLNVYEGARIPKPPADASVALKKKAGDKTKTYGKKESEYVSYLYHSVDKYSLPTVEEFQEMTNKSLNVVGKFSTLDKIMVDKFHDLVVQVVRPPYNLGDKVTLWVTDYTVNNAFFDHVSGDSGGLSGDGSRDGDPYGYTSKFCVATSDSSPAWLGPFGKMSLQVSCWEPHATFLLHNVKDGAWVSLRNVNIKFGRNGQNLEGFMRGDRDEYRFKDGVCVTILETGPDRDSLDPRLVEALKRKRDHEKKERKAGRQTKNGLAATPDARKGQRVGGGQNGSGGAGFVATGVKRKNEEDKPKSKSKLKREKRKANARAAERLEKLKSGQLQDSGPVREPTPSAPDEIEESSAIELNPLVKCEAFGQKASTISEILQVHHAAFDVGKGERTAKKLPFVNLKYRAEVRVVDFFPCKLEDFAVRRKISEYDALSDDEDGGESSDGSSVSSGYGGNGGTYVWEWRFTLVLEDAVAESKGGSPVRMEVLVDKLEGQCLTGLDPEDLRANPEQLSELREKMFGLWGNLEELKRARLDRLDAKKRLQENLPPPCSDADSVPGAGDEEQLSNLPFSCCIKQYGVKTKTNKGNEANAGKGHKWTRVFALFGTKISPGSLGV
ncbi:hypothetical protein MAPG_11072 [Magnaporthiopsis poae ATCC 64411]|uniref:Protection of telomeres protein 1 n=1 Tax=Magnaporthiopsis poae (strain ATCC 64411 / 73-15) TaxID=644358 RepID=A0A0C4EEA3_MAGP6|nr:hypothetical protein MAPG_11072 [Magnaporthiopsis poae ATCC 64411]